MKSELYSDEMMTLPLLLGASPCVSLLSSAHFTGMSSIRNVL